MVLAWFLDAYLPTYIQTPLVQSIGAISAALIALRGVKITLEWNRLKHVQDRNAALRKESYIALMSAIAKESGKWVGMLKEGATPNSMDDLVAAQASVRLFCEQETRNLISALMERVAIISQSAKEKGDEILSARCDYEDADPGDRKSLKERLLDVEIRNIRGLRIEITEFFSGEYDGVMKALRKELEVD